MTLQVKKIQTMYFAISGGHNMTNFEINGEYCVAWSQRQFLPVDLGAWVYIAKVDQKDHLH